MADDEEAVGAVKQKTCILRASIHCEGCKKKVKKILSRLQGVEFVDVDTKQHKVMVTGNVDADVLIKKLIKSGKNAELWPQISDKISGNGKKKEIQTREVDHAEAPRAASDNGKLLEASTKLETPTKNSQGSATPVKPAEAESGGGGGDAKPLDSPSLKTSADVKEKISEDQKKSEESCSVAGDPPLEKSNGGACNNSSGTSGKRKKKKGQSGNNPAAASVHRGLESPPPAANQSPPRNHHQVPFMPPQPVYAVSYNTAYPTSSYAASTHYAAPPPHAQAYMQIEPPSLDPELNPRQPLDSFEMFSDENPNGCFIM